MCTLYIYESVVSQLWVRESVRYITHNSYAISVVLTFNNNDIITVNKVKFNFNDNIILINKVILMF